jgi:glutamate--cysteine ligase
VVNNGRKPGLTILEDGQNIDFKTWCESELGSIREVALILDSLRANNDYNLCINKQLDKVAAPSLTPSAKVLKEMQEKQLSFSEFGLKQSNKWQNHFQLHPIADSLKQRFTELAENSHAQQRAIEAVTQVPFDEYLTEFYLQYQ